MLTDEPAGHDHGGRAEQLSPLDAAFLAVEDHDPNASVAMGLLVILSGRAPREDELIALLDARLAKVPRLRQVVRPSRWGLDAPQWVEHPSFTLAYHLRRAAVPRPGDDSAVATLVAHLMESRLSRERPLWELWTIEGLSGGRWAMLIKGHHCLADGLAGLTIVRGLLADGADGPETPPDASSRRARVRLPVRELPRRLARLASAAQGLASYGADLFPLRPSGLAGSLGHARRFGTFSLSLDAVRATAHRHAVTINDLMLAGVTAGLRGALLGAGTDPASVTVRTLVPVTVAPTDLAVRLGNQLSMLLPRLPVEVEDPVLRLHAVHRSIERARAEHELEAGAMITAAAAGETYGISAWLVDLLTRLPQSGVVALTTNLRGPAAPLAVLGRPVVRMIPYVGLGMGLRVGVAALSYHRRLAFGVSADYDLPEELDAVVAGLRENFVALRAGGGARTRSTPAGARPPATAAAARHDP